MRAAHHQCGIAGRVHIAESGIEICPYLIGIEVPAFGERHQSGQRKEIYSVIEIDPLYQILELGLPESQGSGGDQYTSGLRSGRCRCVDSSCLVSHAGCFYCDLHRRLHRGLHTHDGHRRDLPQAPYCRRGRGVACHNDGVHVFLQQEPCVILGEACDLVRLSDAVGGIFCVRAVDVFLIGQK